jgi:hypothetical protein
MVDWMFAWVTSGLVAPGVHFGSGKPPTDWQAEGIPTDAVLVDVVDDIDVTDENDDVEVVLVDAILLMVISVPRGDSVDVETADVEVATVEETVDVDVRGPGAAMMAPRTSRNAADPRPAL